MQDCERNQRRNYMRQVAQLNRLSDVLQLEPLIVAGYLRRLRDIHDNKEAEARTVRMYPRLYQ